MTESKAAPIREDVKITLPEGVSTFDATEKAPSKLGLKKLFYGFDTNEGSWSQPDTTEVRALYEPGDILVIFDNQDDWLNASGQAELAEKLNKVGNLVARLINITQIIQTCENIVPIIDEFQSRLMGKGKLPDDNSPPLTVGLAEASRSVAVLLDNFQRQTGAYALLEGYKLERAILVEQLKSLDVRDLNYQGLTKLSSYHTYLNLDKT